MSAAALYHSLADRAGVPVDLVGILTQRGLGRDQAGSPATSAATATTTTTTTTTSSLSIQPANPSPSRNASAPREGRCCDCGRLGIRAARRLLGNGRHELGRLCDACYKRALRRRTRSGGGVPAALCSGGDDEDSEEDRQRSAVEETDEVSEDADEIPIAQLDLVTTTIRSPANSTSTAAAASPPRTTAASIRGGDAPPLPPSSSSLPAAPAREQDDVDFLQLMGGALG
ncbi:hypothetical protein OC845_006670 [Tilletia horrida]|nr:hypothetical protein OC845_006670 [Tilletia horrida]